MIGLVHNLGVFVPDFDSQPSDTIDTDIFLMLFLAVDGKEQVCNESAKNLRHQAMGTAGYQVVHLEVLFPPAEKDFYIPVSRLLVAIQRSATPIRLIVGDMATCFSKFHM